MLIVMEVYHKVHQVLLIMTEVYHKVHQVLLIVTVKSVTIITQCDNTDAFI